MTDATYGNGDVARIIEITPRQVLLWSEKRLVKPAIEARGAGHRRAYDYVNLLEFGLVKHLLDLGLGIETVKRMLDELRQEGMLRAWAGEFLDYLRRFYMKPMEFLKRKYEACGPRSSWTDGGLNITPKNQEQKLWEEMYRNFGPEWPIGDIPENQTGILFWMPMPDKEGFYCSVLPLPIDLAFMEPKLASSFLMATGAIVIDVGRIKRGIDERLK
jgi:DNA-binding transcriptional MerR regulator